MSGVSIKQKEFPDIPNNEKKILCKFCLLKYLVELFRGEDQRRQGWAGLSAADLMVQKTQKGSCLKTVCMYYYMCWLYKPSVELNKPCALNRCCLTDLSSSKMHSHVTLLLCRAFPSLYLCISQFCSLCSPYSHTILVRKSDLCHTCTSESGDSNSKVRTGRAPSLHKTSWILSAI